MNDPVSRNPCGDTSACARRVVCEHEGWLCRQWPTTGRRVEDAIASAVLDVVINLQAVGLDAPIAILLRDEEQLLRLSKMFERRAPYLTAAGSVLRIGTVEIRAAPNSEKKSE
jgi:hypothetical protein